MIRIEQAARIAEIEAGAWDSAAGRHSFLSRAWLSWGEEVLEGDRPHYLVAHSQRGVTGAMLCYVRRREQLPVSRPLLRALLERYLMKRPLVICQAPLVGVSGLRAPEYVPDRGRILSGLVDTSLELLHRAGASFLVIPYLSERLASTRAFGDSFFSTRLPPNHYLPIRWRRFDGFIASRRRSVRKDYRLHANRASRLGLNLSIREALPDPQRGLELVRMQERRHRAAPHPWAGQLLSRPMGDRGRWLVVEQGERMVGCGLALSDRRRLSLTLLGLDPGVPQVYFSLMYGAVRHAIETGAEGIYGGGGAGYFKSRLGYVPMRENHVRVYAASPNLRWLGRWLAGRETAPAVGRLGYLGGVNP